MVKSEPEVYKHSNASELHPYSAIAESIKFKVKYPFRSRWKLPSTAKNFKVRVKVSSLCMKDFKVPKYVPK